MEGYEPKRPAADTATTENLKHLAGLLDRGEPLSLKINGRRVALPADTRLAINLDRDPRSGCVEVDIRWVAQFDVEERPTNAGRHPGNAGAPACMSAKHENNDERLTARRTKGKSNGPHIRLKALITAPTI